MRQEIFNHWFELLKEYKKENGDLLVPQKYVTSQGEKLGKAVNRIRSQANKLNDEQRQKLNDIGFVWRVNKRRKSTIYKKMRESSKQ